MKLTRDTLENLRHTGRNASPHGYATRAFHWLAARFSRTPLSKMAKGRACCSAQRPCIATSSWEPSLRSYFSRARSGFISSAEARACPPTRLDGKEPPSGFLKSQSTARWPLYSSPASLSPTSRPIALRARRRIRTDNPLLAGTIRFHVGISNFLLFLIYAHIAYALWHWIFRQDGLWESMTGHSLDAVKDGLQPASFIFSIGATGSPPI